MFSYNYALCIAFVLVGMCGLYFNVTHTVCVGAEHSAARVGVYVVCVKLCVPQAMCAHRRTVHIDLCGVLFHLLVVICMCAACIDLLFQCLYVMHGVFPL